MQKQMKKVTPELWFHCSFSSLKDANDVDARNRLLPIIRDDRGRLMIWFECAFQSQDNVPNYEGVEWDSFEMDEDSKSEDDESKHVRRHSPADAVYKNVEGKEQTPVQRRHSDSNNKPTGSIGKLKISSEMRAKLELVTIGQVDSGPSTKETNTTSSRGVDSIPKLEDNRRLMLQQQLGC